MSRRVITLLTCLFASAPAAHAAPVPAGDASAFKPTVAVRLAPLDKLLDDVRYTATLISRFAPTEQEAKEFATGVDQGLDKVLGPDWRKAVDATKPLLGFATVDAKLPESTGGVLIPVKDEAAFRKLLANLVGRLDDPKDGIQRFEFPGQRDAEGRPINGYLRIANGYAYLTLRNEAAISAAKAPTPEQVVAGDPTAGISARINLDRVPGEFRQRTLGSVQQFKAMVGGAQGPGVPGFISLAGFALYGPIMALYPLVEPAVRDGRELTIDMRFDRKHLNLGMDLTLTAQPGSELEKLTRAVRHSTSLFPQIFGPETAGRAMIRTTIPEDLRKLIIPQIEMGFGRLPDEVPVWGKFTAKIGEAVLPTLKEGEIDLAVGLRGPYDGAGYGLFGGLRLKDAAALEKAFRTAVQELPKEARAMFVLDSVTIGETKVHAVKLPPLPEPAKSLFGTDVLLVAFRNDAMVMAFGQSSMGSLHDGLDAKPQPTPKTLMEVSGKRLVPLVTKIDAEAGKKFQAFLGNELDRIPILEASVEGGAALKAHFGNVLTSFVPLGFFAIRTVAVP
ncbi:MAG TPA: hypothetical protein VH120_02180 [Gemmataceae bacterium]|nr:hypothetical protein [Gemmataceae bacterium]